MNAPKKGDLEEVVALQTQMLFYLLYSACLYVHYCCCCPLLIFCFSLP